MLPPAVCEGSDCPTFSTSLPTASILLELHLDGCQVVSHCDFDLYFPDG